MTRSSRQSGGVIRSAANWDLIGEVLAVKAKASQRAKEAHIQERSE